MAALRPEKLSITTTPQDAKELQEVADGLAATGSSARFVPRRELRAEIGTDEYFGALLVPDESFTSPACASW